MTGTSLTQLPWPTPVKRSFLDPTSLEAAKGEPASSSFRVARGHRHLFLLLLLQTD